MLLGVPVTTPSPVTTGTITSRVETDKIPRRPGRKRFHRWTSRNDSVTGGDGDDLLVGGNDLDVVSETANIDFTLSDSLMTGLGNDLRGGFEYAQLSGGVGGNRIDTTGFTGNVTLVGGPAPTR
ncbi:MAG: hypothetical protein CM1200mP2_09190 [Planctomycetaceae bacterium]|nr:MAG: hypothetical protein CM1200mP2_09190 [Planctomycetaceae bacterium]GIT28404.1 MAG: hypothetical protein Ct9H300mP1_04500 [Planctomycetaceae bacterium]